MIGSQEKPVQVEIMERYGFRRSERHMHMSVLSLTKICLLYFYRTSLWIDIADLDDRLFDLIGCSNWTLTVLNKTL